MKLEMKKKIFISYSHKDKLKVLQIVDILKENDYHVLSDQDILYGEEFSKSILKLIQNADYILVFLSKDYVTSVAAQYELNKIIGYSHISGKLILPVLLRPTDLPVDISRIQYLNAIELNEEDIAVNIIKTLSQYEGQKIAEKEIIDDRFEKIESSITVHIEPILEDLKIREEKLRKMAGNWYFLGYISLVLGIIGTIVFILAGYKELETIEWEKVVYSALKATILLVLLISLSKYSFTLAKSYMHESLKNADRTHAISFGKFYIKVFEKSLDPQDFKEIFQNWNLNNNDSSFSGLTPDSYDPKIVEGITKIFDSVKEVIKK